MEGWAWWGMRGVLLQGQTQLGEVVNGTPNRAIVRQVSEAQKQLQP